MVIYMAAYYKVPTLSMVHNTPPGRWYSWSTAGLYLQPQGKAHGKTDGIGGGTWYS